MPLWGRKLYQARNHEKNKSLRSPNFKIPFTGEVFDSEKEYTEQLALYQQPLWTCQSTGDSGLSYEEALASEAHHQDLVDKNVPASMQKAILQYIHHTSGTLDSLVEKVEDHFENNFHIGEVVELAKCKGKIIKGKVLQVKIDSADGCNGTNGSPSSDKENHGTESELLRQTKTGKNALSYNIQIGGKAGKVVSCVPAEDLIRCDDLPPPYLIKLLIQSNALQAGTKANSPWVVSPDVTKVMDIRNKLIETMLPSTRISIRGLKGVTKRKPSLTMLDGHQKQPSKKRRLEGEAPGPTSPTRGPITVDVDQRAGSSPEKVYLDHSYSSPNSKSSKSSSSPEERVKTPPTSASREKQAKKQSTLEAAFSGRKKSPRRSLDNGKPSTATTTKKRENPKLSKKKSQVRPIKKFDKEINVIDVVDTDSSDDSGSDDSDVVLMDLHVKLSPIKDKKLPAPIRRTLADHFLSSKRSGTQRDEKRDVKGMTGGSPRKANNSHSSPLKNSKDKKGQTGKGKSDKKVVAKKPERTKGDCELAGSGSDSESQVSESSSSEEGEDAAEIKQKKKVVSEATNKGKRKLLKAKLSALKEASQKTKTKAVKRTSDNESVKSPAKPIPDSRPPKTQSKSPMKSTSPKKNVRLAPKKTLKKDEAKSSSKSSFKKKTLSQLALEMKRKKASKSPTKLGKGSLLKGKSPQKAASSAVVAGATGKTSPRKAVAGKKTPTKTKTSPKKTPKSKSLKQSTLFKFSAKKKSNKDDSDDDALILYKLAKPALTPVIHRDPPIALKLLRAKRQSNRALYTRLVGQAARILSKKQIQALKPVIQGDVMARAVAIEAKLKWDKMTPEEKAKVMEAKKLERVKKRDAERRKKQQEEKEKAKRFEDQLLELKPLVVPKPVPLPEGLPNTLFGDIAMVVEFINCYSDFLMPEDPYPITTDSFMKALSYGKEGFGYLSRILVILLKTLLQDQITEEFIELGMKLSDIPVNMHTASELLRLSLLQTDTDAKDKNDDESDTSSVNEEEGEFTAPQELVELLETTEFFSLSPEVKLELMVCVCNRILTTYSLVDYMEDKQKKAAKLWVQKMQTLKEKNNLLKEEKKKRREEREAEQQQKKEEEMKKEETNGIDKEKKPDKKAATKKGKKEEPKKEAPPPAAPPVDEPEDLASIVKRRRIRTAQAKQEQEEQAKKDLERRQREQEEQRIQREKLTFEKSFEEGIQLAKQALRRLPVGTDRNHNRYWVFSGMTPGLYVEKGWVSQEMAYTTSTSNDGDSDNKDGKIGGMVHGLETSVPKEGQNLWFQYETTEEFDSLLDCLNNTGIRESALYGELKKRYDNIRKLIVQSRKAGPKLRDSDGDKDLLDSFKEDLKDIECHVSQGNLGGVANYEKWEKKVDTAKAIKDFVPLLLQSQSSVSGRFLESIMKPPRVKDGEEEPNPDEVTEKVLRWREAVRGCVTMSRLHVLLSIYEVCVRWEKSSENAKCKICRKKGVSSQIILCDECNQPFHLLCLRPALTSIPKQAWKCPSCAPLQQRACRKRNYKELDGSSSEESEESEAESEEPSDSSDEEDVDPECCVCGTQGEEDTAVCSKCRSAYHKDCHQPPMRNLPRTEWLCYPCRSGRPKKKKAPARKGRKRGRPARR